MTAQEVTSLWDATPEPRSISCNERTASRLEKKVKDKVKVVHGGPDGVVWIDAVKQ